MTDFIEGGPFRPPICEQPQKSSSWIGLITWKVAQSKRKKNNNKSWARNNFQKTSSKFSTRILLPHEWDLFIQSLQCERPVFPDIALRETSLSSHCTVTDLFIQSLHCERPVYPVIALWETCLFKDTLTDTTDTYKMILRKLLFLWSSMPIFSFMRYNLTELFKKPDNWLQIH